MVVLEHQVKGMLVVEETNLVEAAAEALVVLVLLVLVIRVVTVVLEHPLR